MAIAISAHNARGRRRVRTGCHWMGAEEITLGVNSGEILRRNCQKGCKRMSKNAIAEQNLDKALISEVALEIGKDLVAHIERMYPDVYAAMNSGCKLSVRNHIHNDIMWAIQNRTEADYRAWIEARKASRRNLLKIYRNIRATA